MITPVRLQLSRRKGFNLQALSHATNGLEAVNVARPSRWGNPYMVKEFGSAEQAVAEFRALLLDNLENPTDISADYLKAIRGKNLACWCKPGTPCHADVLLEIANK